MLQHLHSKDECYSSFDLNYFSILDLVATKYQTKLKESMYIDWEKRNLEPPPICPLPYESNQFLWVFFLSFDLRI